MILFDFKLIMDEGWLDYNCNMADDVTCDDW